MLILSIRLGQFAVSTPEVQIGVGTFTAFQTVLPFPRQAAPPPPRSLLLVLLTFELHVAGILAYISREMLA